MRWLFETEGFKTNRLITIVDIKSPLVGTTVREFSNASIIDVISVTRKKMRPVFLLPILPLAWLGWTISHDAFNAEAVGAAVAGIGALVCLGCYALFRGREVYELWIRPVNEKRILAHSTEDWATAYECYREAYFSIMGVPAKLDPEDEAACIEILEARRAKAA